MELLEAIVYAHATANAANKLTRLAPVVAMHWPQDSSWKFIQCHMRPQTLMDEQGKAVHMVCNTVCLPLHGQMMGTKPTLMHNQPRVMHTLAQA